MGNLDREPSRRRKIGIGDYMSKITRRTLFQTAGGLSAAPLFAADPCRDDQREPLRIATFSCDVTPPLGSPIEESTPPVATSLDTPLFAKGVVLCKGAARYVLCALDYCELHTTTHDLFRRKVADALGVNELQVEIHCIHQHDAPLCDIEGEILLSLAPSPVHIIDIDFMEVASDRVAAAAREALSRLRPCTHIGCGKAKVEKFASNRRVRVADGSVQTRYAACHEPELIAAPEGIIDPWLRTITFFDGERPLARLHYYASHPQSYYGKGHVNSDTPGLARERLSQEEGIPQIYFTGCGGNVGAGKYNDGSPKNRPVLAERLYQGMKGAIQATTKSPSSVFSWKTLAVPFAQRESPGFSEAHFREVVGNPEARRQDRTFSATVLSWYHRLRVRPTVDISCFQIGPARILHLPGEPFVEYQLFAQSVRPDDFIAVAGYGDAGPGYICTESAYSEGAYEPTQSLVSTDTEPKLKDAIRRLLI